MKPHYKDFFLYLLAIIIALLTVLFLFSVNTPSDEGKIENKESTTSSKSR